MADQKVSQLPALTGAGTAAGDLIYIVDISEPLPADQSKKITLTEFQSAPVSAGTANGVLYLNGSKVVSSGSALIFDGSTFAANVTNARLYIANGGISVNLFEADTTLFRTNASSELMRLNSTGLGIGTSSPTNSLSVVAANAKQNITSSTGTNEVVLFLQNTGGDFYIGRENSAGTYFTAPAYSTNLYSGGAYPMLFWTNSTERMRIDSSGNLGLGVTPSAWTTVLPVLQVSNASFAGYNNQAIVSSNFYYDAGNKYIANGFATQYVQSSGSHIWYTAPNNTSGAGAGPISFTQAMTLHASGGLSVGNTTDPSVGSVNVGVGAANSNNYLIRVSAGTSGLSRFIAADTLDAGYIDYEHSSDAWVFRTAGTERARITSGGDLLVGTTSNTGLNGSVISKNIADVNVLAIINSASSNPYGPIVDFTGAAPNDTTRYFLYCKDTGGERATIRSNGGFANYQSNDVDLSDIRTKTDINPLGSYWNKIAGLEIVTYKYKDQSHDDLNIGVIAQQVEQVAPEFVDSDGFGETPEDGVPLKTIYNKDLTFAAIKALQEAMARIEALEAKIAALEA